jgi:integral membrane sensor domain MASE1
MRQEPSMLTIKILSGLAFIGSVAWFIAQCDYEPAIAMVTSLSTFIAAWLGDGKIKRQTNQKQTVGENGIGIQAGGDVSTGNLSVNRKTTNAE